MTTRNVSYGRNSSLDLNTKSDPLSAVPAKSYAKQDKDKGPCRSNDMLGVGARFSDSTISEEKAEEVRQFLREDR